MGLQLPAVNNLLVASGQTLALIGTYIVYLMGSHSLLHIALVNTMSPFLVYLIAYPITFFFKYPFLRPTWKQVSFKKAKEVMTLGVKFFVLQISGVVLFMSSNILISKLFNPAMVTPYQITYRYFFLLQAIFTVICTPYWNATTDAYERNDMAWIKDASKKLDLMTLLILICAILMTVCSNIVYAIWIGSDVKIDIWFSVLMAVYNLILIFSMRYSYMLNGFGKLRLQLLTTITAAILFIPLSCAVVAWKHDILYFMGVMCLVNIPGLIVNCIQLKKIINGTASGIWNQA
jgi:O-antigen/teichoic acid export membrane protein